MIKVCEVFKSIYGEAPYMGRPAVFVRLSGCNLKCPWCDEREKQRVAKSYTVNDLISEVVARSSGFSQLVVITGGEPLVQKDELLGVLREISVVFKVSIETNGTMIDREIMEFAKRNCIRFVISPKIGTCVNWGVIKEYRDLVDCVKFVVGKGRDDVWTLDGVDEYVSKNEIRCMNVALMPLSLNNMMDNDWCREVWDYCVKKNYVYSDRLHIRLNRR